MKISPPLLVIRYVLIAAFFVPICAGAQFRGEDVLRASARLYGISWEQGRDGYGSHWRQRITDSVRVNFEAWLDTTATPAGRFFKMNRGATAHLFDELRLIGPDVGQFSTRTHSVLDVYSLGPGKNAVAVLGMDLSVDLNTIQSGDRERVGYILAKYLLPEIEAFGSFFPAAGVQWFGMSATYGARDFLSNDRATAETVLFLVPMSVGRLMLRGDITEDELVRRSDVMLQKGSTDFRRVEVELP